LFELFFAEESNTHRFELDGTSSYGDYGCSARPPGNRHFIPRRAKLKAAGGEFLLN